MSFLDKILHCSVGVILLLVLPMAGGVQAQHFFTPEPESKIWIEGSSNIQSFTCLAEEYEGRAEVRESEEAGTDASPMQNIEDIDAEVRVVVERFECGRRRMNRDLYQALKTEDYSYIIFDYVDAETLRIQDNRTWMEVRGRLTVAGKTRPVALTVEGILSGENRVRITGEKRIRMTDYDVDPPSGLFGLVRADDELTVYFDIYARADTRLQPDFGEK